MKSVVAKSMCEWVHALDKYANVLKKVAPKQAKYEKVSAVLKTAKEALAVKEAELKEVTDKVVALEATCLSIESENNNLKKIWIGEKSEWAEIRSSLFSLKTMESVRLKLTVSPLPP